MAESGLERARHLARAALAAAASGDLARANTLVGRAERIDGSAPSVSVVSAAIVNDASRVAEFERDLDALEHWDISLVGEAILRTEGVEKAIAYFRRAVMRYPEHAGLRLRLSQLLLGASMQPGHIAAPTARREARRLALEARDMRRRWRGPSASAVAVACHVAMASEDLDEVLKLGQAPPSGEATVREAATEAVRLAVFDAALARGRSDLASEMLGQIQDPFELELRTAQLNAANGDLEQAAVGFRRAWSLVRGDDDKMAVWFGLARLGEDLPDQSLLETNDGLESTIILAEHDVGAGRIDAAINRLRGWRNRSSRVAERLAELYVRQNQIDDAVATLDSAAARFDDPRLLVLAAQFVAERKGYVPAEELAQRALTIVGDDPRLRTLLHEISIAAAQEREHWREMESRTRTLIDEQGATHDRRWLLVGALFNQRQHDEAWAELQTDPALGPNSEQRARVWMDLHVRFSPGPELAEHLLGLIDRFGASPDFTAAAIGHFMMMAPQRSDVSDEVGERWQARIGQFLEEHPGHPGFFAIQIPEDPEQAVEALRPYLEPGSGNYEELRMKVADVELPYGILSAHAGKPYAAALLHRAAGCLPIRPADDRFAEIECAAARESLNGSVVVDASTLVVASYLEQLWPRFYGAFARVIMPLPARTDIVHAADEIRRPSQGMMGWNPQADSPTFTNADDAAREHLQTRAEWVLRVADDLDIVDWPRLQALPGRDELADEDRFLPWLASLDYAVAHQLSLYVDDLAIRTWARSVGVPTFGTVGVLQALAELGIITGAEHVDSLDALRRAYCVDFPLDIAALSRVAEQDSWRPGPAALPFIRPITWRDGIRAYRAWRRMCGQAASVDAMLVPGWLQAAIWGAAHGRRSQNVTAIAAALLSSTIFSVTQPAEALPNLLSAARAVVSQLGGDDLLPVVVTNFLETLIPAHGPQLGTRIVLALAAHLEEQDRALVRELVFAPNAT